MCGSASCTRVSTPNQVTMPSLPSRKSPPSGMMANERNAGTNERNGASAKTNRSERRGNKSSLKNNLMPSASVCKRPYGPALFGPMRFCMPAITLRSNHTMSIVATRPTTKTTSTFSATIASGAQSTSPSRAGSSAGSIAPSNAAANAVTTVMRPPPPRCRPPAGRGESTGGCRCRVDGMARR